MIEPYDVKQDDRAVAEAEKIPRTEYMLRKEGFTEEQIKDEMEELIELAKEASYDEGNER